MVVEGCGIEQGCLPGDIYSPPPPQNTESGNPESANGTVVSLLLISMNIHNYLPKIKGIGHFYRHSDGKESWLQIASLSPPMDSLILKRKRNHFQMGSQRIQFEIHVEQRKQFAFAV